MNVPSWNKHNKLAGLPRQKLDLIVCKKGLWQKVTGKHAQIQKQNETEAFFAYERDKKQNHDLRSAQMNERRGLQTEIQAVRQAHTKGQTQLYKDLGSYHRMQERQGSKVSERFNCISSDLI